MTAAEVFLRLDRAGLSIKVQGARLVVQPATLLTDELRALARRHKDELLALARHAEERAALAIERAARGSRCWQRMLGVDLHWPAAGRAKA